jgi:hypothetical protein
MDFWSTIQVVFRRWYVALPAFLLSIVLAAVVYGSVQKVYVSGSVLVLTQPLTGSSQPADVDKPRDLVNPLLNFDRGLSTSAAILIQALSTPETASELGAPPGADTWFEVSNGSTNPELLITGPFIFITGNSSSKAGATDIVRKVQARAQVELANRQKEVKAPASTYITAVEVVAPTTGEAAGGSRIRSAAAAGALAMLASLAATFGFESYALARARRREREGPDDPDGLPDAVPILEPSRGR